MAEQLAFASFVIELVTADQLSEETVELVEKIAAVDFEEAFQHYTVGGNVEEAWEQTVAPVDLVHLGEIEQA